MKKKLKPLNCFYCDHGKLMPGCSGCFNSIKYPPTVECGSLDIGAPEIFDLHHKKVNPMLVSLESWLPYHCGHFLPRMVEMKCSRPGCSNPCKLPEWAVSIMFMQNYTAPFCSRSCSGLPTHIKARKIQDMRGQDG